MIIVMLYNIPKTIFIHTTTAGGRSWHTGQRRVGVKSFLKQDFIYLFLEREDGREKREVQKHQCERKASIDCLLRVPQLGTEPTTKACDLARNRTGDSLLCGMIPNQLSHTGKG